MNSDQYDWNVHIAVGRGTFRAECTNELCDWSRYVEESEFNQGHAKTRMQQEANHHEKRKRVFDGDPTHPTEVYEKKQ